MIQSPQYRVFIQANPQQLIGAKVAAHAVKRHSKTPERFSIQILDTRDFPFLAAKEGRRFLRGPERRKWTMNDLQSFTLLRFMPPQMMNYEGRALVLDPDCFALADVCELFEMDMQGGAIWCRKREKDWATSVMLLDCAKLLHWRVEEQFEQMFQFTRDYAKWIRLSLEEQGTIRELPSVWNDLDRLTPLTRILHNTKRRTQPWKTGLPVDFTTHKKWFGIPFHWLPWIYDPEATEKAKGRYKRHPDLAQEQLFFKLLHECVEQGTVTRAELIEAMELDYIRHDALAMMDQSPLFAWPDYWGQRRTVGA